MWITTEERRWMTRWWGRAHGNCVCRARLMSSFLQCCQRPFAVYAVGEHLCPQCRLSRCAHKPAVCLGKKINTKVNADFPTVQAADFVVYFWEAVWILECSSLDQSGLPTPVHAGLLNDLVTDAYRGFACFPGPYRVSQEMLCFTCVPGKLQKKKTCSFYSSSDSDTSLSSERCSSAEREVSSTVFLYISLYSRGNRIKNLKKLPTTWEVLLPATTRQKLEVLQIQ